MTGADFSLSACRFHGPAAPLGGLENSGWKLTYDETRSDLMRASEQDDGAIDASYSIGLYLREDGTVSRHHRKYASEPSPASAPV